MKSLTWWQWILVAVFGLPSGFLAASSVGWIIESLPFCVGC